MYTRDAQVGMHDVFDEDDFYPMLARLIVENLEVEKWLFKIDNMAGGRGLACVRPSGLNVIALIRAEKASHPNRWV